MKPQCFESLSSLLSEETKCMLGWIGCWLSFYLLHSVIKLIYKIKERDLHKVTSYVKYVPIDLIYSETQFCN